MGRARYDRGVRPGALHIEVNTKGLSIGSPDTKPAGGSGRSTGRASTRRIRWSLFRAALSLAAFLLALPLPGHAQKLDLGDLSAPTFVTFTSRDGVPDSIGNAVQTDTDGFVWLSTAHGLARYDGHVWSSTGPAAIAGTLGTFLLDHSGSLWVAFRDRGIGRWDGTSWHMQGRGNGLPTDHVATLAETVDTQGRHTLWAATVDAGLLQRNAQGQWLPVPGTEMLPHFILSIAATTHLGGRPRVWVTALDGLWFQEDGHWQKMDLPITEVQSLRATGRGEDEQLWITTIGRGLWRIDRNGVRTWSLESGELPTNDVYSTAVSGSDDDPVLWVSSRAGVLRVHDDRVRTFGRSFGLPSDAVRSLSLWRSPAGTDVLWVATEAGVARAVLGGSQWQTVSLLGEHGTGVFGLLPEADGHGGERLWVAANSDGLGLYENGAWRTFSHANGLLPSNDAAMIRRSRDDTGKSTLWLGMNGGGLFKVEEPGPRFVSVDTPWPKKPGMAVQDMLAVTFEGKTDYWFALNMNGVHRLRDGVWTTFKAKGIDGVWRVRRLIAQTDVTGRNWLWAAGRDGLARFDGEHWDAGAVTLADTFLQGMNLLRDEQGRSVLWLGTLNHAIVRVDVSDPAQPRVLPDELPRAPDQTAYGAVRDSKGRIYVCTNASVQQLTPQGGSYQSRVFTRRDGLLNDECNGGSQLIDAQDRFWTGTLGGAAMFDPAVQVRDDTPKPLRWLGAQIDGAVIDTASITVPPGRHELIARYALLSWQRETESRFRSQLIGYESAPEAWTAQNSRVFSNLPPGHYRLRVEARDYAGNLSRPLDIAISVQPLWWQRGWAWGLFAALTAGLIAMLWRWRVHSLKAARRVLERQIAERTAELHEANQRLRELSYSDSLTGLANRRRLLEALHRHASSEGGSLLAMISIDVDHFKAYNDRYGHPAGDEALRRVAEVMRACAPAGAIVARQGGEEFACVLEQAGLEQARQLAETFRTTLAAHDIPVPGTALRNRITLSAGIACAKVSSDADVHDLLRSADVALYQAKREGRNRICG